MKIDFQKTKTILRRKGKVIIALIIFGIIFGGVLGPVGANQAFADDCLLEDASGECVTAGVHPEQSKVEEVVCLSLLGGEISMSGCLVKFSYHVLYSPTKWLLGGAGELFDAMIAFSLSSKVINSKFANDGWEIVRGIANITFIFILLYIAFAVILQLTTFNTKKVLANLIIVALLINFSLFFTKVIIDASNILALTIYNSIVLPSDSPDSTFTNTEVRERNISAAFVAAFNPQNIVEVINGHKETKSRAI